jgi:hypothetical protein
MKRRQPNQESMPIASGSRLAVKDEGATEALPERKMEGNKGAP